MTMERIALISMPFARVEFPSLALTQLKAILDRTFGDRISVDIRYLNQDFATFIGVEANQTITDMSMNNGVGEWFFRQVAFPDLPDNTIEFFRRTYPRRDEEARRFRQLVIEKRQELGGFLEGLIDRYELDKARIVGFTSMFSQNVASIALARILKQRNPAIVTAVGGANCEHPMGAVMSRFVSCLDYVFSGPALKSFPTFVSHLLAGEDEKCRTIPGVFCAATADQAAARPPIGEELDIDESIPLDYDRYLDDYEKRFPEARYKPSLLFETSRGCWWGERSHCTFCGLNGLTMKYRAMAPVKAVALIESLFRYAGRGVQLQSVDNILPREYLTDVLPKLTTPAKTSLFYEVKADLTEADFDTLARARVKFIQPGIEALATQTLKLMKKGTTSFQNIALLKNCALRDIDPAWNLLVGFPGEPAEVYEKYVQDLPQLIHMPAPIGVAQVRFDRYSPYFTKTDEYGLKLRPFDFYQLTYPFPEDELATLAYYFYDDNVDAPYITELVDYIGPLRAVVENWKAQWSRQDGGSNRPKLHLERRGPDIVLVDSRDGILRETALTPTTLAVLARLERPMTTNRLRAELAGTEGLNLEAELAFLLERRLLFCELDRMMSLVLPRPPAPVERRRATRNPAAVA